MHKETRRFKKKKKKKKKKDFKRKKYMKPNSTQEITHEFFFIDSFIPIVLIVIF